MKHHAFSLAVALVLLGASASAQSQTSPSGVLEGRLRLSRTEAVLNEARTFKFDPERAQCFTARGQDMFPTTCATLVGVGYADKARLTVVGDTVVRLDILELHQ